MTCSPSYLRERLRYDPETGKLYWRHYEPHGPRWNGRWAGREAFTADDGNGYRCGSIDNYSCRAHRVIFAMVHDRWPEGEVDHEGHDRAHNRTEALRECNRQGNARNASRSRANTSGVTGVIWYARDSKWRAQIMVDGRGLHLGYFDVFEDAVAARRAADAQHGFHPNHGRNVL